MIAASGLAEEPSLYVRLGGQPVVERVVTEAVAKVTADPRVNQSFAGVNLKRLDSQIEKQICFLTGGGCTYDGDDMKTAHAGLNITEEEFYALVDAFRDSMNDNGVGEREKNELLRLLAPMKRDIVTH
jgi:hemoglobin